MHNYIYIPCDTCESMNRASLDRLEKKPVCSFCRSRLPIARPLELIGEQFDKVVVNSGVPVLVEFYAEGHSHGPTIEETLADLACSMHGCVLVARVNVQEAPELAVKLKLKEVPTLVLFQDGRECFRKAGRTDPETIQTVVDRIWM